MRSAPESLLYLIAHKIAFVRRRTNDLSLARSLFIRRQRSALLHDKRTENKLSDSCQKTSCGLTKRYFVGRQNHLQLNSQTGKQVFCWAINLIVIKFADWQRSTLLGDKPNNNITRRLANRCFAGRQTQ